MSNADNTSSLVSRARATMARIREGFYDRAFYLYRLATGQVDTGTDLDNMSITRFLSTVGLGYGLALTVGVAIAVIFEHADQYVLRVAPAPVKVAWFLVSIPVRIYLSVVAGGKLTEGSIYLHSANGYSADEGDRVQHRFDREVRAILAAPRMQRLRAAAKRVKVAVWGESEEAA